MELVDDRAAVSVGDVPASVGLSVSVSKKVALATAVSVVL